MTKRKTILVSQLIEKINKMIAELPDTPDNDESRIGLAVLAESVLFDTGNYEGFNYLGWLDGGANSWHKECERVGRPISTSDFLGNKTRIRYCVNV